MTTAVPFSSSSPTFSSPTRGLGRVRMSRMYTVPRCAKPTSSRAEHSTLAPASSMSTGPSMVGSRVPTVARSTPSKRPSRTVEAASSAPVFPAEMNASDSRRACSSRPTTMLDFRLRRTACSGFSAIPITSGASTSSSRLRSSPG